MGCEYGIWRILYVPCTIYGDVKYVSKEDYMPLGMFEMEKFPYCVLHSLTFHMSHILWMTMA